jgi:hypothetical protein
MTVLNQHFLIVTPDPNDPDDQDLFTYAVECPGVTDECRRYEDCVAGDAERELLEEAIDNGEALIAHGVNHLMIDGVWCAATNLCNVCDHDGLPDAAAGRFPAGRHAIDYDFGDGTEIAVYAPDPEDAVSARIRVLVSQAPRLSDERRARLAAFLRPTSAGGESDA